MHPYPNLGIFPSLAKNAYQTSGTKYVFSEVKKDIETMESKLVSIETCSPDLVSTALEIPKTTWQIQQLNKDP